MTRYACAVSDRDYLKVSEDPTPSGNVEVPVYLGGAFREEIFLPPATARALAKALKKAAKRAERGA